MSKILYEYTKINDDLISIIRSYLCIKNRFDISKLINKIRPIYLILNRKYWYDFHFFYQYEIKDCVVQYDKYLDIWTIRRKNYQFKC